MRISVKVATYSGLKVATGRGCVCTVIEAMKHLERPIEGAQVAVQGFGNVGRIAARLLQAQGATVVAVSDSRGGIHCPQGLDPGKVRYARYKCILAGISRSSIWGTKVELNGLYPGE